jgi:hypothetical protein
MIIVVVSLPFSVCVAGGASDRKDTLGVLDEDLVR